MKRISIFLISALVLIGGIAGALNAFASDNGLLNENLQALSDDWEPNWRIECYKTITTTGDLRESVTFCADCKTIFGAMKVEFSEKGNCIPTTIPDIQ